MDNRSLAQKGTPHNPLIRWGILLASLLITSLLLSGLAIVAVCSLPASALEGYVSTLTRGTVRLAMASGTVRSGKAEMWVRDEARRKWQPWRPLSWEMKVLWRDSRLSIWPAIEISTNLGVGILNHKRLVLSAVNITLPPSLLLVHLNHPLANAPWQGNISLSSEQFTCDRATLESGMPLCDGKLIMRWQGMETSILPMQEFGNYTVTAVASSKDNLWFRADIVTESGTVLISGFAEGRDRSVRYQLKVKGEKSMMIGLSSVVGPLLRGSSDGSELALEGSIEHINF